MKKKLILLMVFVMGMFAFVGCDGEDVTTDEITTVEVTTETPTTEIPTTEEPTTEEPTTEEPTTEEPTTEEPTTEEPTTEITLVELPDFKDKMLSEIETTMVSLGFENYHFIYETNLKIDEGTFIAYANQLQAGQEVPVDTEITIIVSTETIYLPDLTGLSEIDVDRYLMGRGIYNYDVEIITDNTVENQTFAGYKDFEIGDRVVASYEFIVYIGYNSEKLPDLTGMIERQIELTMNDILIPFSISYEVNDDFPEGTFAYYKNHDIGDFYDEESVIEIVVYQNTFTNAEESLIISKYVDSETDSAIELYNPTSEPIFLGDYHLVIYTNGSYEVTYRIDLDEEYLLPGETYLIVSTVSEPNLQRKADLRSADLLFDGNDTIQLRYLNNTYIDTIYHIGDRALILDNETFVRRDYVNAATRNFDLSEWTAFIPGYYDIIGSHPLDIEDQLTLDQFEIAELLMRGFYHELGGMNLVEVENINDGDTASFTPGFTGQQRVRFIGADTPETSPTVVPVPEPWGLEAKAYLTTILNYARDNGKSIYIQSDPDVGYTEGYGRHLGLIWVDLGSDVLSIDIKDSLGNVLFTEELTGVILINYHIVKNGFSADEYKSTSKLIVNNRYMARWFDEAEKFAKDNHLGIHE